MKVLITGFGPFGEEKINPSVEAVRLLPDEIEGVSLIKLQLPVVFGLGAEQLIRTISRDEPDIVICTGLAGGRNGITPEMAAVNLKDARIPDNAGQKPVEEKIIREGPESLLSTLPVRKMKEELSGNGIPCDISYSAGTFVCNEVMYRLLFYMKESGREKKAGFIHVPYAEEFILPEKDVFTMPVKEIMTALEICIRAAIT